MDMILTKITHSIDSNKRDSYIYAVTLMGLFTVLFLGVEYFFVNVLSHIVSEDQTVLAQNYALGVSAAGFVLYALFEHFCKDRLKEVCFIFIALLSVLCMAFIYMGTTYTAVFFAGLVLFLLLGLTGSAAFYTSMCRMKTEQYLARTVGISYALGILLQFVNNNLIRSELAEMIVLFVFLLILIALLLKWDYCKEDKVQTNLSLSDEEGNDVNGKIVGILLILLVLLMTCIFSTLDNAVTLVHSSGEMDIGQWPRILLAFSGLVAGFVFDFKNRKYMGIIMYCVMVLSTICIAVLRFSGSFLVGLIVFYLSTGFFSVFFTCGFMEISRDMKVPKLWAGMGRAVNNMTAAVIANPGVLLLSSECDLVTIVLILVLFVAVSIVAVMYTFQKKIFLEELIATVTEEINDEEKLRNFSELFSFTERESEVFDRLVNTEDNNQEIAESLFVSRRTLERHISAIYEKTGVKSRIGLLNLYNK